MDRSGGAVWDGRQEVGMRDDVELIAEATVPGNHDRAGLARHDGYRGYSQFDETIERSDLALDTAAAFDVDDGKLLRIEYVAGNDHIGPPEEREDVAIGVRCILTQYFDRLAVQVHVFPRIVKHLSRPPAGRRLRHVPQNSLGRENWSH